MKILYAASEAGPFIRSGGLGDVAASLPKALVKMGADCRLILPLYEDINESYKSKMVFLGATTVALGWRNQYVGLYSLVLDGVTCYFVDNEFYFKRKGIYGFYDDGERFAFFSRAILEAMPLMNFYPDVLNVNDWQTALSPLMLKIFYGKKAKYKGIKTVLTIHNIEFQGKMDMYCADNVFGIPIEHHSHVEYAGNANMLKTGIDAADRVVTVSPTYAKEIMDPFFSCGLEGILNKESGKISGIVNGIDTDLYDPNSDKALFKNFDVKAIKNKPENKKALQKELGLPVCNKPLVGLVTRLTTQKGIDLIMQVIDEILALDLQIVVLGTGDSGFENAFKDLAKNNPTKVAVSINFSGALASKIYGASDLFLMPSKFEPCGLSQLIAMRYGSVPIVRETGGLKDTILPFDDKKKTGTGFTFANYDAYDMLGAIKRAVDVYNKENSFKTLQQNAMNVNSSWENSAKKYLELYKSISKK